MSYPFIYKCTLYDTINIVGISSSYFIEIVSIEIWNKLGYNNYMFTKVYNMRHLTHRIDAFFTIIYEIKEKKHPIDA